MYPQICMVAQVHLRIGVKYLLYFCALLKEYSHRSVIHLSCAGPHKELQLSNISFTPATQ